MEKDTSLIVNERINLIKLKEIVYCYDNIVKGVCDIVTGEIAMGGEWHSDAEQMLSNKGNNSNNIWGFNIAFEAVETEPRIVYTSMINIKPVLGYKNILLTDIIIINKINEIIENKLIL